MVGKPAGLSVPEARIGIYMNILPVASPDLLEGFVRQPASPHLPTRRVGRRLDRCVVKTRCAAAISALLLFRWIAPAAAQETAAPAPKEKPVAVMGGEVLYEKDYLPPIQGEVQKIRMQEYDLRLRALEDAVNKRLLKAEAAKKGVSEEEWLRTEIDSKVEPPTQDEIDQEFVSQMFSSGGQAPESRDAVAEQLKKQFILEARDQYFQGLRRRAGVKILLLPPTVDVGYDPQRVRGNPDAPITIIEFSDFHCPYCEQAYSTLKTLLKKYDGKVKLAYRDLPLIEAGSPPPGAKLPSSAEAARCAGEQGKFWEFHDLLFENQDFYRLDQFQEFAASLGMDKTAFTNCLESGKFKAPIQADMQEAVRLGITGTPGFYINGVFVNGARPIQDFEDIIDTELALMEQR
jgi:protein-disulfide isomerase